MARTLDASLTSALASHTRRPALTLTAEDHIQHLQSFQTPNVADAWNDACIANDGSIVRVQVTRGGGGFTSSIKTQRITNPSTASQWSTWTTLSGGSGNMFQDAGCAISVQPNGDIFAFGQRGTGGNNLWVWKSTNNGSSWTGPVSIISPPGGALIKGIGSAGHNDVWYFFDVVGGENVSAFFFSAGAWGGQITWPFPPLNGATGLAPVWVAGVSTYYVPHSDGFSLNNFQYVPAGSTWTGLQIIAPATSTAIARYVPRASFDSTTGLYSVIVIESDSGLLTGSVYSYPRVRQSADMIHWSNGFILPTLQGITYGANYFYLAAPQTGSSGARYYVSSMATILSDKQYAQSDATRYLDVSSSILSYQRREVVYKPGELSVVLDNNAGVLNNLVAFGNGTPYEPIGKHTTLVLSEGYDKGTPPTIKDVVVVGKYHISSIQFLRSPQENSVRLIAYDLTKNLDLVSRYQNTWLLQTVSWLITEICARGGIFSLSLPSTTQMSQVIPSFTLQAGHTYRQTLNELCATYSLTYFFDQTETLQFRELSGSDPSVWTYQPEVELLSFGLVEERSNHIIVSGKPPTAGQAFAITTAESIDNTNMQDILIERVLHYVDQKLTTAAECLLKANFLMAQEQRGQTHHQVIVPANPALQLLDVITLNDANAPTGSGQSGTARIDGVAVIFDSQLARYDLTLALEGV